jgi:hypothetical protein
MVQVVVDGVILCKMEDLDLLVVEEEVELLYHQLNKMVLMELVEERVIVIIAQELMLVVMVFVSLDMLHCDKYKKLILLI